MLVHYMSSFVCSNSVVRMKGTAKKDRVVFLTHIIIRLLSCDNQPFVYYCLVNERTQQQAKNTHTHTRNNTIDKTQHNKSSHTQTMNRFHEFWDRVN